MIKPNVTVIQPTICDDKEEKIRAAAYYRVSSDSTDQLNSFMAQVRYYESFLADNETETLIGVYADEGVSGTCADKRDEFQRLMNDCRKGKIDRIYTKSISRFARNTRDCLLAVREFRELGITIFFEKENIDTANISDEMMVTIMGALAQEESSSISQNMKWAIRKRMKNGTYIAPHAPYGYQLSDGKLEIEPKEAEIVIQIYNLFLSGMGIKAIARFLNEKSIIKNNTIWHSGSVQYILMNEKYIGDSLFAKTYTPDILPFKSLRNMGQSEKYYVTQTHQSIIKKEIFEKVQKLIEQRKLKNYEIGKYIFTKKITCGHCGAKFKRRIKNEISYWICGIHDANKDNCPHKPISETHFYDAFMRLYNKLKYNHSTIFQPLFSQLQDLKTKKFNSNKQFTELSKEIAQLKEQNHVLTRLKTKGFLDDAKYFEQINEINGKLNKLAKELQIITRCDDEDDAIIQIQEVAGFIENGIELMIEFDEVMFESSVEKIIVISQNELEFKLYGGLKFRERLM